MPLTRREFLIGSAGTLGSLTLVGQLLKKYPGAEVIVPETDRIHTGQDEGRVVEYWAWSKETGGKVGIRWFNSQQVIHEMRISAGNPHPTSCIFPSGHMPVGAVELYATGDVEANMVLQVGTKYQIVGAVSA